MRFAVLSLICLWLGGEARAERAPPDRGERAFTGCHPYPESKRFRWGVRGEVGVGELVASLADVSCRPIVIGSQAAARGGKVTLEIPDFITASEIYHLFLSALEVLGLTVEESGRVLKIVDAGRGKEVAKWNASAAAPGDQFVIRLLRLEHTSAAELADVLAKLKSKEGEVLVHGAGSLLLIDRAAAVRRMEELGRALDIEQPGGRLWGLATHGQTPSELAAALEKILQAAQPPAAGPPRDPAPSPGRAAESPRRMTATVVSQGIAALVPVDAARLLVVVASDDGFHRVAELARRIDPPNDEAGSSSQAHVIYLSHTNAEEMAQTLAALGLTGRAGAPRPPGGASATGPSPVAPPAAGAPSSLQGEVRIAADKVSNAIVVFAGASDFWMVRELVAKLDVPRRQVYVEATILDLSVDRARQLGITLHSGDTSNGATAFAGTGSSGFNSIFIDVKSATAALGAGGLLAGVLGPSFKLFGQDIPSFGVLLQALEQTQDVNVISKPHLLTMDNTKASLLVGQSIPFQTASSQSQLAGLISTYTRQDVALKLDLTPHLNDSDSIRLELEGEISDVPSGQDVTRPSGPITNKRTIKTAIVVRDGDTVVLGGLQKDGESESVEKVPLLGDLPILGWLFQHRSRQRVKQDLLIVLTPWVIRGPEDLKRIFERKECERREFVERMTAFKDQSAFEAHVDYRRKRGLLEEINLAARRAELDATALRNAERALRKPPPDGPLESSRESKVERQKE